MRRTLSLLSAGAAAAGLLVCYGCRGSSWNTPSTRGTTNLSGTQTGAGGMVTDLTEQNFDIDVLKSRQPVLIDFYATWCGPCKRMAPIVDGFASVHKSQFRVFRCDIDSNRGLANRYGIDAVPTFMVFKNGTLVGRFAGSEPADTFETQIVSALN